MPTFNVIGRGKPGAFTAGCSSPCRKTDPRAAQELIGPRRLDSACQTYENLPAGFFTPERQASQAMVRIRTDLETFAPYVPGKQPDDGGWVKLNTNEASACPPGALAALKALGPEGLIRYPEPTAMPLRQGSGRSLRAGPRTGRRRQRLRRDSEPAAPSRMRTRRRGPGPGPRLFAVPGAGRRPGCHLPGGSLS